MYDGVGKFRRDEASAATEDKKLFRKQWMDEHLKQYREKKRHDK